MILLHKVWGMCGLGQCRDHFRYLEATRYDGSFANLKSKFVQKNARTGPDGKNYLVDNYNLDVAIAVGYRVKSPNATAFRKWATNVLKEY